MTRTFDVATDWRFPTLGGRVVPEGGRVEVESARGTWDEFDTASGELAAAGVELVRSGDVWTLTVDDEVLSYPAAGRVVPAEVRDLLLGVRAGPFPAAAAKRLKRAGAVPVEVGAKVEDAAPPPPTVGAAVRAEVVRQRLAILRGEFALRRGDDAVHRTRVAIRRLRSVLRLVPVTEAGATAALDAELRWLAGVLGAVRDAEVLRGHLRAAIERTPDLPPAAITLIENGLDAEHATASAALTRVLAGRRYLTLLKTLRAWGDEPPFTPDAAAPVARLRRYVRTAERRLERRMRRATDDADLHRARKAAKRLRYTADIVPGADTTAKRAERIQERLGRHQDAVVAAAFLARLAAGASGEAAFGCGVLWAREMRRARKSARPT